MATPLDGIRVIEIASWVAAPSAGAILADLGADVIKVEPIGGDASRGMLRQARQEGDDPIDHPFQADNRGKRSIAVALDDERGAELVRSLVESADVLLTNLLPRRQRRFGLDPDTLLARRPGLVHATLTGYGTTGPEAERPGYDVTAFFGRSGLSDAQIEGDNPPPQPRPAQGDHTTGIAMALNILAALRLVERTGEGQVVDVSLFATAVWTLATDFAAPLADGRPISRRARDELISPLANRFPCGDGRWIVLNMPEPHWWPRFCETIGRPEWIDDERFDSVRSRFAHMRELVAGIDEALSHRAMREWGEIFDAAGLIWGPAQSVLETTTDPQADAIGVFPTIDHPRGRFRTVAAPVHIVGCDIGPRGPGPATGEHTEEVLDTMGLDHATIAALRDAGVVGIGP